MLMKQAEILQRAWGQGREHMLKYLEKTLQKFNNNNGDDDVWAAPQIHMELRVMHLPCTASTA